MIAEGRYEGGEKEGKWVGCDGDWVWTEGSYSGGKKEHHWNMRGKGQLKAEGSYKDGKKHGVWLERDASGVGVEGLYKEGQREGVWFETGANLWDYDNSTYSSMKLVQYRYVNGKKRDKQTLKLMDWERMSERFSSEGGYSSEEREIYRMMRLFMTGKDYIF